jgi:methylenetetrahydrofolate dehydrogenase (NADP+)/methenyltetrahydrofolate cyclohydrolase
MSALLLDGKKLAAIVRDEVKAGVAAFRDKHGRVPGLEVILVGDDAASVVYTRNKEKASIEVGMRGKLHTLPASSTELEITALVAALNADPAVDGILVQLPLPSAIAAPDVLDRIDPTKDVDGLHPANAGLLLLGRGNPLVACTPLGCMRLLELAGENLKGAHAVVVGRSAMVGKPMAQLLLGAHATVTMAHSRTRDLPAVCRTADVLIAAVGKAELIRGDWIKPGATVIDVGINRVAVDGGRDKLVGDVAFHEAVEVARAITPVPGGVGPMTIAMLLANTLRAAERRASAPFRR